jgi:N-acetylglutamate synthase-like GNAT family acetyltransferase
MEINRIDGAFGRWDELLALILSSFAYMDGIIDPPSSAHRLTLASLAQKASDEMAYVAIEEGRLTGCIFLKPEPTCLYVGKLAVAPGLQGTGIGRRLLAVAEDTARALQLPALRLETRIELIENHATFSRWGFLRTAEKSHAGFDRITFVEMKRDVA